MLSQRSASTCPPIKLLVGLEFALCLTVCNLHCSWQELLRVAVLLVLLAVQFEIASKRLYS